MIPRPPRSTPFPTRRSSDLHRREAVHRGGARLRPVSRAVRGLGGGAPAPRRSEEHTSELQSRQYLVCRLLLEKKKQKRDEYTKPIIDSCAIVTRRRRRESYG